MSYLEMTYTNRLATGQRCPDCPAIGSLRSDIPIAGTAPVDAPAEQRSYACTLCGQQWDATEYPDPTCGTCGCATSAHEDLDGYGSRLACPTSRRGRGRR